MAGAEQDDICAQLARSLYVLFAGPAPDPPTNEYEDVIEQGRQIAHEAMYRAAFEQCVARKCHT